jgi:phosphate transport system substrate-binding protein
VALANEKGVYPVPFAVAYDSIIPVVHPSNPLSSITLAQLKDIYTGKVTNFKEIGGPDLKIVICSRDTSSGTFETWISSSGNIGTPLRIRRISAFSP